MKLKSAITWLKRSRVLAVANVVITAVTLYKSLKRLKKG